MEQSEIVSSTAAFERLLIEKREERYVFRLYVTGMTPLSMVSIAAIKSHCEQFLAGRYELEVINLSERPERARENNIIAAPTLIKELPLPMQRLVGDLTNSNPVMMALR